MELSNFSSILSSTAIITDVLENDSEGTEHKMVLVLAVSYNIIDGSYEGVRINAASSEDVCSSYMAAVLSTRI